MYIIPPPLGRLIMTADIAREGLALQSWELYYVSLVDRPLCQIAGGERGSAHFKGVKIFKCLNFELLTGSPFATTKVDFIFNSDTRRQHVDACAYAPETLSIYLCSTIKFTNAFNCRNALSYRDLKACAPARLYSLCKRCWRGAALPRKISSDMHVTRQISVLQKQCRAERRDKAQTFSLITPRKQSTRERRDHLQLSLERRLEGGWASREGVTRGASLLVLTCNFRIPSCRYQRARSQPRSLSSPCGGRERHGRCRISPARSSRVDTDHSNAA